MGELGNISALSKSWRFSNEVGPLKRKFQMKLVSEKQNDYPLIKISVEFFCFAQSTCVTERETDGQNRDPQYLARIAALHGKNVSWNILPAYKYDKTMLHI